MAPGNSTRNLRGMGQSLVAFTGKPMLWFDPALELTEAIYVGDRMVGLSQFWDWAKEGHARCPGATVVYDKPCPIYEPEDAKDYQSSARQRDEVRRAAFDPAVIMDRNESVTYWRDVADPTAPSSA